MTTPAIRERSSYLQNLLTAFRYVEYAGITGTFLLGAFVLLRWVYLSIFG